MLICYHNQARLPQSDLIEMSFLFAAYYTITCVESGLELADEDDWADGFLAEVPFLRQVPQPVQVELLGETWSRHHSPICFEATLLDAAIVYAAGAIAAELVQEQPSVAAAWLSLGRRNLNPRILRRAPQRLESLFDGWWEDRDFLMLEAFADLPPEEVECKKAMLRLPDEMVQPMFDALGRGRVSPDVGTKLVGLLPDHAISHVAQTLLRPRTPGQNDDHPPMQWGLEDTFHDVLVGPCPQDVIHRETVCDLLREVGVWATDGFDCSYEEWHAHLLDAVHDAAQNGADPDLKPFVGHDDEAMLPLHFETAEEAFLAFQ